MKWIVLCIRGARIASFPLTDINREVLKQAFHLSILQTDASGTEYYDILAVLLPDREIAKLSQKMEYDEVLPAA